MALFTGVMVAGFLAIETGFFASAIAFGLNLAVVSAATLALNYVTRALSDTPAAATDDTGVQLQLGAGGDVPRSFGMGYHVTAGSLVYANYWGHFGETPNALFTQVIALSDLPGEQLVELWVNGEKCSFAGTPNMTSDTGIVEYTVAGVPYLSIRYYDGTQTTADALLTGSVSSAVRPYQSTRVGRGICYAILTSLVNDKLFTGFPTFKFGLSGIKLYDISKDSTAGGSGSHVYSNPATWGGDGDQFPAVQIYNLLRGIKYGGAWVYGLQNMGAARLPAANWIAQIGKCRTTITGESGPEPSYRSGGQINFSFQPANVVEGFLTACQGRLSEIGGFYKIYLGAPDSSVFSWTDADLLSSEGQSFRPFFSLADSVNGIQGRHPDPAQGWEMVTAPALYRTDLELKDGNRRLMANPSFDFVPYRAQVQRLQKSGIQEAQRARTHTIAFPPAYWIIEPGDVGQWSSFRNGYSNKLFRVDSVLDKANLDIIANVTEIDPADYSWNHPTDFQGVAIGPNAFPRPPAQGVKDWAATATYLIDDNGITRRPAIRITWDGTLPGIIGIQYEVRLNLDLSEVAKGRSDQYEAGALIVTQGLVGNTTYQIRGQYIPSSPRDMLWSGWITVTTPDVTLSLADFDAALKYQVTQVQDYLNDRIGAVEALIASVASNSEAGNWIDHKQIRDELTAVAEEGRASITDVRTVQVNNQIAFASYQQTVAASFASTNASVTTNASAIATLNGFAAAQYSVTLDVNGYASGFNLINGGAGISTATFVQDKFQIAAPGVGGGAAVPIFTVANVNSVPKIAIRGDMYADGTIFARSIVAGDITAVQIAAGTITSDSGVIGALSVKSLSIAGNAATVPNAQSYSSTITSTPTTFASFTMSIDTTGLSGVSITIWAIATCIIDNFGTGNSANCSLIMNGSTQASITGLNWKTAMMVLSAAITITGSGGVMSVPVSFQANVLASTFSVTGSLFAICAKR
jgi:hypothetical protein